MPEPMPHKIDLPIACDLTAIPLSARTAHVNASVHIFAQAEAVQALPAGYAFRFANVTGMLMQLAQFVENERHCCQFFAFTIELEPAGGPLWLKLTGGDGVKEFVQVAFGDMGEAVAQKLINTGNDPAVDQAVSEAAPLLATLMAKATSA